MQASRPLRPVTAEEIACFERDGVVCLRGVLPASWLARMAEPVEAEIRRAVDLSEMARRIEGSGGRALADAAVEGDLAREGRAPGRFFAGTDHWRHEPAFHAFAAESPLPALAAALMRASRVHLYEDSLLVKEPGTVEPTAFHQDLAYFHVEGEQVCTVWCPLDPVTRETGAVGYVRGSHRWERLFQPNLFVSEMAIPRTQGEPVPDVAAQGDRYDVVFFELEPGDVTVHHARTLHGAVGNRSRTRRRRAISVRYCGDDVRYRLREGAPRKPHQDRVRDGDPLGGPDCPVVWRA